MQTLHAVPAFQRLCDWFHLMVILAILVVSASSTQAATYSGSHLSSTIPTDVVLGADISVTNSVKNTGSATWYSFSEPGWIYTFRNISWQAGVTGTLWESRKMNDAVDAKIAFYAKQSASAASMASAPSGGSRAGPGASAPEKPPAENPTEALRRAVKVLEERSGQTTEATQFQEAARRVINEISATNLVLLSKPSGLPVFLAPHEALKKNSKDVSSPTSLAEKYVTNGFPKAVGDSTCFKGETPIALPRMPDSASNKWVACVVYALTTSEPIKGIRSLKDHSLWSGYGKIEFALAGGITSAGTFGLRITGGSCLIFDSRDEGSGQIQIVDQSQIRTVILFKSIQPGGRPLEFDFGANALYAPISEETLPANALEK